MAEDFQLFDCAEAPSAWTGHDKVLNTWIEHTQTYYLRTNRNSGSIDAPPGSIVKFPLNNAYPRRMAALLDKMDQLSHVAAFNQTGTVAIRQEAQAWLERLKRYKQEQALAMTRSPDQADDRYQREVAFPILTGLMPDGQQRHSESIVPIQLAFAADVAHDSYIRSLCEFGNDLVRGVKDVVPKAAAGAGALLVVAVLVAAFGFGLSRGG